VSRILFAEIKNAPITKSDPGTIVYRGDSSFFLERQKLKGRNDTLLQDAIVQISGRLVKIEGAWFEDSFAMQTVFFFNRQLLSLDLTDFIQSQNFCAARMYQVEKSSNDAAFVVFGHQSVLGSRVLSTIDPASRYGSAILKTFSIRRQKI